MGRLVKFPSAPELTIYLPLGSSPDEYQVFTIPDDSLSRGTIYKGDVVVVKLGLSQPSGLHAVITPTGKKYVAFLVESSNGLITIETNNDEYEPETYRRDEIEILGRVVQVYPGGNVEQRWELICSPRAVARRAAK